MGFIRRHASFSHLFPLVFWPVHAQRLSYSSCLWLICAGDRDVAFEGGQRLQSVTGSEAASGTWPFDADGASSPVAHVLTPVHTGAAL